MATSLNKPGGSTKRRMSFSLDATIDQRYYTGLIKRSRAVTDGDREPLARLIGSLIDQQNLPCFCATVSTTNSRRQKPITCSPPPVDTYNRTV